MKPRMLITKEMMNWQVSCVSEIIQDADAHFIDGIPIEKGVILTKEYLDANQELFTKYLNLWILYPDLFLDAIQSSEDKKYFHLFFY